MTGRKGRSGGNRRLPSIIKQTKGTERPSRRNLKEPTPTPGIPLPPAWLEGEALENYHRLGKNVKEMGVVSVNDGDALALTAAALVEYIVTQKKVKREGTVIQRETKFGRTTIANPNVAIRNDAWRRASDGLSKFGLDPRSRGTVSRLTSDEPESEFFN